MKNHQPPGISGYAHFHKAKRPILIQLAGRLKKLRAQIRNRRRRKKPDKISSTAHHLPQKFQGFRKKSLLARPFSTAARRGSSPWIIPGAL
jgi:hypothetical protein